MTMPRLRLAILPLLGVLCVGPACNSGGSSGSSTDASGAPAPLAGRAPTGASQLLGTWFATSDEVDFEGIEFQKEGKALLGDGSAGVTVDFSMLEGGRLSLVAPGGMTTVFQATIAGDQLELKGEGSVMIRGGTQRYRRLKSGQTIADAKKEARAVRAKAYQERVATLQAFLKQPDLVLAFTSGGPSAPGSIALEVEATAGGFSGKAWHDDRPPHLNAISGQLNLDEVAGVAQVVVTYGRRIAPPAVQPDGGGQITMKVEGEGKSLRISAQVSVGGGPAQELVLRADGTLHAEIVKRYEAEIARIESLKQPLLEALKDYALLRGQLQSADARKAEPDTADLTLVRDARSGQFFCEGVSIGMRDRGELVTEAAAEVVVVNDRAWLRIVCPPSREYLLALAGSEARKLSGQWGPPGANGGKSAEFSIVEALDARARDAAFEARRGAIKAIQADSVFTGLAFEDSGFGLEMPIAFRLQVTVQPDGTAAGTADYPTLLTRMTVTGALVETRVGPVLELRYSAAESTPGDKIFLRSIQGGTWRLLPAPGATPGAAPAKLTGYFTGPPVRPAVLTLVDKGSTARLRRALVEAMGSDGRLHVSRFVGWQTPGITPTVVEWKLDEATGKLTGSTVVNGRALGTNEKLVSAYEGQLKEENGWLTLEVLQITPFHSYDRMVGALKLYAGDDVGGRWHLNGLMVGLGAVPNDKPLPPFPEKFERCIDLVPVSATDPQTHAEIDKAIAGAAQAKAEVEAAAQAAQAAATEARRAKMAPFFPLLRSQAGLAITTDAPLELSGVILEAAVDEEKASITGKGIDLREMPLREFTLETGIDNWGNLTLTTSISKTPYAFAAPKDGVAAGRGMALKLLSAQERASLDALISLGKRLQGAPQAVLAVEVLDAAGAKAREPGLAAADLPGIAIYKERKNDQVATMFTAKSNGRFRWAKEPVALRLKEPLRGKALYIKGGGPTDNLTVVINGVHRVAIASIAQLGGASITLPPDLELLDIRLEAGGTAQARGVVLVK